jgi:hypothetical protein
MCDSKYYLLENTKNTNASAKVRCVKRCPVFYKPVGMDKVSQADKDRFKGDTGNEDPNDAVRNNAKKRDDYFKAKEE